MEKTLGRNIGGIVSGLQDECQSHEIARIPSGGLTPSTKRWCALSRQWLNAERIFNKRRNQMADREALQEEYMSELKPRSGAVVVYSRKWDRYDLLFSAQQIDLPWLDFGSFAELQLNLSIAILNWQQSTGCLVCHDRYLILTKMVYDCLDDHRDIPLKELTERSNCIEQSVLCRRAREDAR